MLDLAEVALRATVRLAAVLAAVFALLGPAAIAMALVVAPSVESTSVAVVAGQEPSFAYDYRPDIALPPPAGASSYAYDSSANLSDPAADGGRVRRVFSGLEVRTIAPQSIARAESASDFARLTRQLQFDEAASVFNRSGGLQPSVINNSTPIIRGPQLGNQQVVKALTADGSNIADWAKYTTQSFQSPSGPFLVHFYRNSATGAVNYLNDYKVVFNGP